MSDLKDKVAGYYETIKLSEKQLLELESLRNKRGTFPLKWVNLSAVGAMITVFFVLSSNFFSKGHPLEKIADEVIYNYSKNLPSEFLVDNIIDLNSRLVKLDFKLRESTRLSQFAVIGGRYCSIQGKIAAQIGIRHEGRTSILYQSKFSNLNEEDLPYHLVKNGVDVLIWVENKILFIKATNILP